ncbi:hypothetical protein HS088_TW21G01459 [Tripterygium wilfordii]|uniref:Bifunctional inhibitor/plant lipid transfer protein/seed storage helical domain-containing protein n=1 Tax=Tripterygium wilfordii TaxID=458696 RepID=A0A7J7C698_TRIWF|nr:hypothetical protein HS088_TW21G01459 [Tripterygium wilfordii]
MTILKTHFSFFSVLALLGLILILSDSTLVHGQQCHGDLQGLISQCATYVFRAGPKRDPSQGCCNVVKTIDIGCACKYITRDIEQIIDMEKVVHVAEFCGMSLIQSHEELAKEQR